MAKRHGKIIRDRISPYMVPMSYIIHFDILFKDNYDINMLSIKLRIVFIFTSQSKYAFVRTWLYILNNVNVFQILLDILDNAINISVVY